MKQGNQCQLKSKNLNSFEEFIVCGDGFQQKKVIQKGGFAKIETFCMILRWEMDLRIEEND